jgi:tripartite-type tricarboxylate transporter receptor subunit TctC
MSGLLPMHLSIIVRIAARAAFAVVLAVCALPVQAESWPSRPLKLVIGFGPGSVMDVVARLVGGKLAELLEQPVVVENLPGASANIASERIAKATPDGYTLGIIGSTAAILPAMNGSRAVDPVQAFTHVILLVTQPVVLAAHPAQPMQTVADVVDAARQAPGRLSYTSLGIATPPHLAAEALAHSAGITLLNVPYTAPGQAMQDLLGGIVPMTFAPLSWVEPQIRARGLRAIAVTGTRRAAALPDVPTFAESGYPDVVITSWFGVVLPAGSPAEATAKLHRELSRVLEQPETREKLAAMGMTVEGGTAEKFGTFVAAEKARFGTLIRVAKIKAE